MTPRPGENSSPEFPPTATKSPFAHATSRSPYSDLPSESFATYARYQKAQKVAAMLMEYGWKPDTLMEIFRNGEADALETWKRNVEEVAKVRELSPESWGVVLLMVRDSFMDRNAEQDD